MQHIFSKYNEKAIVYEDVKSARFIRYANADLYLEQENFWKESRKNCEDRIWKHVHFVTTVQSNLLIRKCGGPSKPPCRTRK